MTECNKFKPTDMFWRILDEEAEVDNRKDWSIDAQINKRVEQYRHIWRSNY
ncbi:hypothetical protein BSP15_232 [Bacillus phage BSP15]|nr:hypothetical protein BSP15_232 [Bacillus phage BSP15]AYJ75874.1 hypothetical protein BSP18_240 [Bacillus phage BSP18]